MKEQKEKSKKAKKFNADKSLSIITEQVSEFTGYVDEKNIAKILDIIIDNENVKEISNGQTGCIVIDVCPFYAEAGGQIGDSGRVLSPKGEFHVYDTQKKGDSYLLFGKQIKGVMSIGDSTDAEIDKVKRKVEPIRKAFPFLSSPLWKISSASAELIIRTKKLELPLLRNLK